MSQWLAAAGIVRKDFLPFTEQFTKRLHHATEQFADESRRPIQHLQSKVDKEALVREIRDRHTPADKGLVAVLKSLETCTSFDIFRNRKTHHIEFRQRLRRCLHNYFPSRTTALA